MKLINVEIKAKCFHLDKVEAFLFANNARFVGVDFQKDTYFQVPEGRLKLREGNIENNLIFYKRNNQKGPKQSDFHLVPAPAPSALKALLAEALGIKIIVEKKRRIYYLENIKIHIDEVPGLGNFIEIEAGNQFNPVLNTEDLHRQCQELMTNLEIDSDSLIENSYSDMLLQ
jgi:predicted adenylyl cyclase CyaB